MELANTLNSVAKFWTFCCSFTKSWGGHTNKDSPPAFINGSGVFHMPLHTGFLHDRFIVLAWNFNILDIHFCI
jgi:hypothetical protein